MIKFDKCIFFERLAYDDFGEDGFKILLSNSKLMFESRDLCCADIGFNKQSIKMEFEFPNEPIIDYCLNNIIAAGKFKQKQTDKHRPFVEETSFYVGEYEKCVDYFTNDTDEKKEERNPIDYSSIKRYLAYILSTIDFNYEFSVISSLRNNHELIKEVEEEFNIGF